MLDVSLDLVVYSKGIAKHLEQQLPFITTKNISWLPAVQVVIARTYTKLNVNATLLQALEVKRKVFKMTIYVKFLMTKCLMM